DAHHHKTGQGQGQDDPPVNAQHSATVNLGRLQDLRRNPRVKIAEDQGGDRNPVHHVNQDQAGDRVVQADALHELDQGNQDALVRNEHAEQQQGEQRVGAAEAPFGQDISVQRSQKGREKGGRNRQIQAVEQVRGQLLVGGRIACQIEGGGQIPHAVEGGFLHPLEAGDRHDVNGCQIKQGEGQQDQIEQQPQNPACDGHHSTPLRRLLQR